MTTARTTPSTTDSVLMPNGRLHRPAHIRSAALRSPGYRRPLTLTRAAAASRLSASIALGAAVGSKRRRGGWGCVGFSRPLSGGLRGDCRDDGTVVGGGRIAACVGLSVIEGVAPGPVVMSPPPMW